jgi:hypothetical protein
VDIPWWGLVVVAAVAVVSIAGVVLVRRAVAPAALENVSEAAGSVYAVVGGVYAVLLAFVVVVVWERHSTAETRVEQEANALGDLFRNAGAFPGPARDSLLRAIDHYIGLVVVDEWATMEDERASPAAAEAYGALWRAYIRFEPRTQRELLWYRTSLDRLNDLGDARRLRLLSSRRRVPDVLWAVLFIGGAITIGFGLFFGTKSIWSQALLVAIVAVTVSLVLLLIWTLQHPFSGVARLDPVAFEQVRSAIGRIPSP